MWTLDNLRLITQRSTIDSGQSVAKLQPLSGGTVYHVFGYTDLSKKLSAYVIGYADQNALLAMSRDGVTHTLSGAGIYLGEYYVVGFNSEMQQAIKQTMLEDATHDCEDPVFLVNLDLAKDE